jgi:hypothetical protein
MLWRLAYERLRTTFLMPLQFHHLWIKLSNIRPVYILPFPPSSRARPRDLELEESWTLLNDNNRQGYPLINPATDLQCHSEALGFGSLNKPLRFYIRFVPPHQLLV